MLTSIVSLTTTVLITSLPPSKWSFYECPEIFFLPCIVFWCSPVFPKRSTANLWPSRPFLLLFHSRNKPPWKWWKKDNNFAQNQIASIFNWTFPTREMDSEWIPILCISICICEKYFSHSISLKHANQTITSPFLPFWLVIIFLQK